MEYKYLNRITAPSDIKKLSDDELKILAVEIRDKMITTVSKNGGHLASNLGVVELTIAMHKVFNSPKDKFVFDVGHQTYTHKLLTGRYSRFDTLRTEDGISGFSNPFESVHDVFKTGHSSTSISSAYGLSIANKLNGTPNYVVSVIGDGAFTGGIAYEAMNNVGRSEKTNMIIILNDNEMSISENVGAIAKYFSIIRSKKEYFRLKAGTEKVINHIPFVGKRLSSLLFRIKTKMKNAIYNSNMFEDLGFRYMGPVDGHNIEQLCDVLEESKKISTPVIVHVHTVKGKGYELAEKSPMFYHGVSKAVPLNEVIDTACDCFSDCFGNYLCELARKDNRICAVTAAMSLGTGLSNFCREFSDRFFDVGIAEEHAVIFTSGIAKGGMIPVFVVYSTFLQRCYDQLIHDAALQKQKMIIAVDRAGFIGEDGETHQGIFDVPFMNTISNFTIYSPSTCSEMLHDMYSAIYKDVNVVAIRYPRGREYPLPDDFAPTYDVFDQYGDENAEIAIVTYGRIFSFACDTVKHFKGLGKNIKVIKLNKIKPLDPSIIEIAKLCKKLFFFEEGLQNGGVGEKLALRLLEAGYKGDYVLTAVDYCFVPQATVESTLKQYKLDKDGMIEVVGSAFDE